MGMLQSLLKLDISSITCFIVKNENPLLNEMDRPIFNKIKPVNLFDILPHQNDTNMRNVKKEEGKSIFDEMDNNYSRIHKSESPSPFHTFDPFHLNNSLNNSIEMDNDNNPMGRARIIITRFSRPTPSEINSNIYKNMDKNYEEDSLDEDSDKILNTSSHRNRNKHSIKRHRNRTRHRRRNNKEREVERPGFLQKVGNFFTSISFSRIFFAFIFSSFFMLIG